MKLVMLGLEEEDRLKYSLLSLKRSEESERTKVWQEARNGVGKREGASETEMPRGCTRDGPAGVEEVPKCWLKIADVKRIWRKGDLR